LLRNFDGKEQQTTSQKPFFMIPAQRVHEDMAGNQSLNERFSFIVCGFLFISSGAVV